MSSLADLRTKSRDEYIKLDRTGKIWSDSNLDSYINRAYLKIQQDAKFWFRQCDAVTTITLSWNSTSALPSDFITIDDVMIGTSYLNRIEKKELIWLGNTPSMYYIFGTDIGFDWTSGTISLYYRKRLPTLTSSQDSMLPSDFDDCIAEYVKYEWFMSVGKEQQAMAHLADYEAQKNNLLATYLYNDNNMAWN